MRILIAAREDGLQTELALRLRRQGHAVDAVHAEGDAVLALAAAPYEYLILDLGLDDPRQGPELVRRLRARASQTPMLALAVSDGPRERIAALDLGCDDCMGAPVTVDEIVARVRAWVRRGMGSASNLIRHGPLSFDAADRTVHLEGRQVMLSRRELSLLEILMRRRGRYVSKDHVAEMMFGWGEEVTANSIEVYVHRLRKKIEHGPVRILSSRGVGYQLERIAG